DRLEKLAETREITSLGGIVELFVTIEPLAKRWRRLKVQADFNAIDRREQQHLPGIHLGGRIGQCLQDLGHLFTLLQRDEHSIVMRGKRICLPARSGTTLMSCAGENVVRAFEVILD